MAFLYSINKTTKKHLDLEAEFLIGSNHIYQAQGYHSSADLKKNFFLGTKLLAVDKVPPVDFVIVWWQPCKQNKMCKN